MIEVRKPEDCCGCTACYAVCTVRCISMPTDSEGFPYALADRELCTGCGKCDMVCPVMNRAGKKSGNGFGSMFEPVGDPDVYAAVSLDEELRMNSSSGGVFGTLAGKVLDEGGVVFGARFDRNNRLVHAEASTPEALLPLMGSKYLQSDMGDTFRVVKKYLEEGRKVLFCGVPCQVAGLSRFLDRNYDNLLKVDLICHGVPSPKVFHHYLSQNFGDNVTSVRFRDKALGWGNYSFSVEYEGGSRSFTQNFRGNPFMKGFLSDLYIRPVCCKCPSKSLTSGSDITLGDFWGGRVWHPEMYDRKGTSAVIINTSRGRAAFGDIAPGFKTLKSEYRKVLAGNPSLRYSAYRNRNRNRPVFFATFEKSDFAELVDKLCRESKLVKLKKRLRSAKLGRLAKK